MEKCANDAHFFRFNRVGWAKGASGRERPCPPTMDLANIWWRRTSNDFLWPYIAIGNYSR
jgi:hypothetical protein